MTTTPNSEILQFTPAQILKLFLAKVTTEDPLPYLDSAYASINPGMVQHIVDIGTEKFKSLNKKTDQKKLNSYFVVGGDNYTQSFWNGCIATLLWLQDYLDLAKDNFHIKDEEVDVCKRVLSSVGLPHVTDVTVETNDEKLKTTSNCRHYAAFLGSIAQWSTDGLSKVKTSKAHTNMEMVRLLSSTALNHFPSVPFAAYFLGQIHNNNPSACAEEMSKLIDFNQFMSPESIAINDPKIVIQTDGAPVVGTVGHPLTNTIIGTKSANQGIHWLGLFEATPEFEKICVSNGLTSQEVRKYLLTIDKATHLRNLQRKNRIAQFVEQQQIIKQALELRESTLVH
jgi:hypothetical protein